MASVHLGVMELHRDGERYLEPTLAIAARPKHQHSNLLNFKPLRLHTLHNWVISNVLTSVTIGTGDFIHIWNAQARLVSLGFTSCFIVSIYTFCTAKIVNADETTK